jgi:hypothetical protein
VYTNVAYLAQSYFHQDFQDEADEPIELVERFRDSEPTEVVEALRAEIVTLIESDATEEDLSRIWLVDAGAYYDPETDGTTMREWLQSILGVLTWETGAVTPAGDTAASSEPGPGIPFKGSTGA